MIVREREYSEVRLHRDRQSIARDRAHQLLDQMPVRLTKHNLHLVQLRVWTRRWDESPSGTLDDLAHPIVECFQLLCGIAEGDDSGLPSDDLRGPHDPQRVV